MSDLLTQLVDEIATEVAGRVVAALRQEAPAASEPAETWRLLTVAEVSKRLGRSERWVRERAKSCQLPWVRLDAGPLAFRQQDLEQFAADRRVPAVETLAPRLPVNGNSPAHNGSRQATRPDEPGVKS